ncbi:hypothetical protein [Streptomyces eurocidicus]|uniref:Uncharacterized protein n=2 Tax=Streptomyces eurocidicus TaxID=66423 RepID=A0A7W8F161_STREU|nr:hypothetical protein [Streptomyces eurocidicus]MBB5117425.1 hypothetical protein [Streptomyces eurocidicus]MBF6053270.1 hypothetical protein [Streptomyces eurocidicus]
MPIMIDILFIVAGVAAVAFGIAIAFNIRGVVTRKVARNYKKLELIHQANGRLDPVFVPFFGTAGYLRFLGVILIPSGLLMALAGSVLFSHRM